MVNRVLNSDNDGVDRAVPPTVMGAEAGRSIISV